ASERAWAARGESPRFYFDWERTRKAQASLDAPFTPPVSLIAGLDVALGLLLDAGLEATFERHVRLGRACREGAKAMGLELFSPDEDRSAVVTATSAPACDAGPDHRADRRCGRRAPARALRGRHRAERRPSREDRCLRRDRDPLGDEADR